MLLQGAPGRKQYNETELDYHLDKIGLINPLVTTDIFANLS